MKKRCTNSACRKIFTAVLSALIVAKSILVFPPLHMRFISLIVVDA